MKQPIMYRQTWAEVDLDAIAYNVRMFRQSLPQRTELLAVVKGDGYGHGAIQVAKAALHAGATWLGVALLEEAIELREAGLKVPILMMGYLPAEHLHVAQQYHITVSINDLSSLESLLKMAGSNTLALSFHLKLDTGMSRLGLASLEELKRAIQLYQSYISQCKTSDQPVDIRWEGLYTHLASADEEDVSYLNKQLQKMKQLLNIVNQADLNLSYIHVANSAGIFSIDQPLPQVNMVRLGISTYGLYPSAYMKKIIPFELKPAFALHTQLSGVRQLPAHTGVSYGATYNTQENEWIGTIPIGYADGWSRSLSNCGHVLIEGKRMPIVGRICMDQTMIKLDAYYPLGTKVTLIGVQGNQVISVDEVACQLKTINYEVPCLISHRVPRQYQNLPLR